MASVAGAVAGTGAMGEVAIPDLSEERREVVDRIGDDVDHLPFPLEPAPDPDHRRGQDDPAIAVEQPLPDDRVGDPAFVLESHEGDIALARPLPDQDDPG